MNKKAVITIVLVLAAVATTAQKKVSWKPFLKAVEFSQRDFVDTIRVKIESGAVIVPVEIAGKEQHCCSTREQSTVSGLAIRRTG